MTTIQDINSNDELKKKYLFLYRIIKFYNQINHYIDNEFDNINEIYSINNLVNTILDYINSLDL